ncbi:hypothetical protein [Protaetiibacter mangrovi]|uniref:Asparagine synthase n=1 Tax=Protaetiibacter mangrovi TaxID=2970926 RepID=A0ABT1ZCN3_9MICO|nr:hypothetical protein [Protaetiibacter mangrovi]MCS0498464.1 hypothetical protein [Protaetiibacter mangrovi]TPX03787.1 hypothetical protein FJ656_15290 [Schumannella luteola]
MAIRIRRPWRPRFTELVDDALLVARAGVRQSVKNVVIMRTLRDGAAYDADWYADAVRGELEMLAVESDAHAARLTREIDYAKGRNLRAVTAADYMNRDVPKLKRRRKVQHALAERLRALAQDPDAVVALVEQARLDALDDIAAAAAEVPQRRHPRTVTGSARRIALADLLDDLAALADERPDA